MGTSFTFRCNKCTYSVLTSGKHDVGMLAVTDTYICSSCNEIVDVLVGLRGETFLKEEIQDKTIEVDDINDFEFYSCPKCNSKDIIEWDRKRKPCPKCNGKMKKDKNDEMFLWD